jgi:hypothetical protein
MVEMVLVLVEDHSSVSLVNGEHAVEEFAADAADEPFGDGVGPWCSEALRCIKWVTHREDMYVGVGLVRVGSWSLAAMR